MIPQIRSDRTDCAAKPAIAAITAVLWNRDWPKVFVRSLLMMIHMMQRKITTKRKIFSPNTTLIWFFLLRSFRKSFLETRRTIKSTASAISMLNRKLNSTDMLLNGEKAKRD